MTRTITHEEYCHDRLADRFSKIQSDYDTTQRVQTLIDSFLTEKMVVGKETLDVGCGLGHFSERLAARGAIVTACDIGPNLVEKTRERVGCEAVVADALRLPDRFGTNRFDLVVSSECIEHTPNPAEAIASMAAVLRPGGYLALSTPNSVWYPVVRAATVFGLRPYDGFEHFSSWRSIRRTAASAGLKVTREQGLHLFPFQLPLHGLSRWCDKRFQGLRTLMINICVLAQKDCSNA